MTNDTEEMPKRDQKPWWKQRTKMERCAIISMAIAMLIIIGLIIALTLVLRQAAEKELEDKSVCLTQDCVHVAENVLKYIDKSVNPCDDFYQFACGRFLGETTIPADKPEVSSFSAVNDLLQQQLKQIIEEPWKPKESKPFTLLKTYYNVCMNTSAIEADNLTTVKYILKDIGGWPVLEEDNWNEEDFDWKIMLYRFRNYGLNINNFFTFNIIPDPKNSFRRIINLDQVELEVSRENLLEGFDGEIVKAYYKYLVDIAELFGADRAFAKEEVKDMMEFKIKLANITKPEADRRNDSAMYNLMNIRELQRRYTSISWPELLNGLIALPIKEVSFNDMLIVSEPQYFSDLEKLLKQSSKRAQANYAIFQAVRSLEPFLPEKIRNREQQFRAIVFGITGREPRWSECITVASGSFSLPAGALYVRKHFTKDAKEGAMKIVTNIQNELVKILEKVDWMDNTTRERAVEKAKAMVPHVAYADELLDDKKLKEYYSKLTFHSNNYLQLRNQISRFKTDKDFGELWNPVNKSHWSTRISPITINAGYSPSENSIQLPAVMLQGVFFNKRRPHYMNYAAMGSIIGHEITHGFDDQGKQYDKDGNLINWWAEETDRAFRSNAKCIVAQYGGYTVPEIGIKLDGVNTQGENIADNGGVKEAYLAYNAWVKRHGAERTLPGLNYTTRQMFWISAANVWCTKERNESLETSIFTDTHSPGRFRVIVPLSNVKYFAEDFKCPVGSKMNPKHKCQVW